MTDTLLSATLNWLDRHGPDEWHRVALTWNWDSDYAVLMWIVSNPRCDKGTAQLLFWLGSPDYFLKFKNRADYMAREAFQVENFDLLETIVTNWKRGLYQTANHAPDSTFQNYIKSYALLEATIGQQNLPWIVPEDMRTIITGAALDTTGYTEGYAPELQDELRKLGISF